MKCHWSRLRILNLVIFNEKYNPHNSSFINLIHSPQIFTRLFFIQCWASHCVRLCKFSFSLFLRLLLLTCIICDKIMQVGTCICVCVCTCMCACHFPFSSDLTVYSMNVYIFMNFNDKQQTQHVVVMWYV